MSGQADFFRSIWDRLPSAEAVNERRKVISGKCPECEHRNLAHSEDHLGLYCCMPNCDCGHDAEARR